MSSNTSLENPPPPPSPNIDDLFAPTQQSEQKVDYYPNRCFINNVNVYSNFQLASLLSETVFKNFNKKGGGNTTEEGEGEEEENIEEEGEETKERKPVEFWKIYGTVSDTKIKKLEDVEKIIKFKQTDDFIEQIYNCSVIIYDITIDPEQITEADWVLEALVKRIQVEYDEAPKAFDKINELRFFILKSTIMTWAQTKQLTDEEEVNLQENDYRKRKPHPNYKAHIALERKFVKHGKKFPKKLKTLVLASGIVYGLEENDLSYLFQMAWLNSPPKIPIFGGSNTIPLIHVHDLASIVVELLKKLPNKQYIVAIEQLPCKLKQITKAVCREMGTGEVHKVPKEEAFLYPEIEQTTYDRITVNLKMEPNYIINDMEVPWKTDLNLAQNAKTICNEFKIARHLAPLRIVIHGPPASGKTRIAKRLCAYYRLSYLHPKTVIDETIEFLEGKIEEIITAKKSDEEEGGAVVEEEDEADEDEEGEEKPSLEDYQQQLRDIQEGYGPDPYGGPSDKLVPEMMNRLIKQAMYKNKLLNAGWVLDNFPKTMDEATQLFGEDEGGEEEDVAEEEAGGIPPPKYNIKTMPGYVFSLEANDDFLCERAMNMTEEDVQGTHYTEEQMLRRLKIFRKLNTDEGSVLNFYDENEVHPNQIDITMDNLEMDTTCERMNQIIGLPTNLGPSKSELLELSRLDEHNQQQAAFREKLQREQEQQKMRNEYYAKMEHWADMIQQLQEEEEEVLAMQSESLRSYLMKFVFPTLTRGLLQVAELKPEDPIDYLAEFLFKENPEGKMFDPAYCAAAGEFMDAVQILQNVLQGNLDEVGAMRELVQEQNEELLQIENNKVEDKGVNL